MLCGLPWQMEVLSLSTFIGDATEALGGEENCPWLHSGEVPSMDAPNSGHHLSASGFLALSPLCRSVQYRHWVDSFTSATLFTGPRCASCSALSPFPDAPGLSSWDAVPSVKSHWIFFSSVRYCVTPTSPWGLVGLSGFSTRLGVP